MCRAGTVAVAKFVEWCGSPEALIEEFVDEADAQSQADYDMAEAVRRSWAWYEPPFDYGTVVRCDRLVIDTRKDSERLAWECINRSVAREFEKRGAAMMLKAFPLEYEGEVTNVRKAAFGKRQVAMMRLYNFRLGVHALPNKWGEQG